MIQIQKHEAVSKFPQLTLIMGMPKVGKSSVMPQLPKALIADLEITGYEGIDAPALVKVHDHGEFREVLKVFFSPENKDYKILVIDHLRQLTSYFASEVIKEHGKRFVEEVEYGKGTAHLKMSIEKELKLIKQALAGHPDKYVFIVAHAIDKNGEVRLDVDGKNESLVLGIVDGVGYLTRDPQSSNTIISFNTKTGVEAGIRNKNLSNYSGVLAVYDKDSNSVTADWLNLFQIAEGKVAEQPKETTVKKGKK